jgi:hypothetical protein
MPRHHRKHRMTREQRKDLLEVIGFIAIIASLIFVGLETRNSTKQAALTVQALEISAYQELMDNITELNMLSVQDAEVAILLHKALRTSEELTDVEQYRFHRNLFTRFRHGDMAYFQFQRGAINETQLRSVLGVLALSNPRVQTFWDENQKFFVESYRDYVNQLIDERFSGLESN